MNWVSRLCSVLVLSTLGVGCSLWPMKNIESEDDVPDYALIAENLVDVLGSLDAFDRIDTTFQMLEPSTLIGEAVFKVVDDRGYGIQIVSGDLGDNFLRYKGEISQTESGVLELYSLSVANTKVERQYRVVNGKTLPISPVTLSTDAILEDELDDSRFGERLDRSISSIVQIDTGVPEVIVHDEEQVATSTEVAPVVPVASDRNVYDIRRSNFASVFANYDNVSSQTLVFANDSLVLGEANKSALRQLAAQVNPDTDVVSVIGCSHGNTALANGNQLLAEGRAQRVTESLMVAGLDPDLILDEACWAAGYWDEEAPRRGVMVTHKRLANQG